MADIQFKCTSLANFSWNHQMKTRMIGRFSVYRDTQSSTDNDWPPPQPLLAREARLPEPSSDSKILILVTLDRSEIECSSCVWCSYSDLWSSSTWRSEGPSFVSGSPLHSLTLGSVRPWIESRIWAVALSSSFVAGNIGKCPAELSQGRNLLHYLLMSGEAKTNWRTLRRIKFKYFALMKKDMFSWIPERELPGLISLFMIFKFEFCSF